MKIDIIFGYRRTSGDGQLSVDEFVESRVKPNLRPAVRLIRDLMREHAPQAQELVSDGALTYKGKHVIAIITVAEQDIILSFSRGSGDARIVRIKDPEDVDQEALCATILQALEIDAG